MDDLGPESSRVAPLPFEDSAGFLIRDLNRAVQREIGARIHAHGVPPGAWYLLRQLWEREGMTQRELAQRVGMTEPTAAIALRGMEAEGWIRRERNESDQRKVHIHLTPAGRALREALMPVAHAVNALVTRGMSPDEGRFLRALLRRARANFGTLGPAGEAAATDDRANGLTR
jgi:DNA-binding MarR family transcriptional regulator